MDNNNWFSFLHSLHDITRNGKSKFAGMKSLNEMVNLLTLKFIEHRIGSYDDEGNFKPNDNDLYDDDPLVVHSFDEDCMFTYIYHKYCIAPKNEKLDDEKKRHYELYNLLYPKNREFDTDTSKKDTIILTKNGKKMCIFKRFLYHDEISKIVEEETFRTSDFLQHHTDDIINLITKIHTTFEQVDIEHFDYDGFGDAYEKFKEDEVANQGKTNGQYFTRRDVVKFIVDELKPQANELCYDPTCGTGGFIHYFDRYIENMLKDKRKNKEITKKQYNEQYTEFKTHLYGNEILEEIFKPLCFNMLIHRIKLDNINNRDSLDNTNQTQYKNKFDVIGGNPPFGMSFDVEKIDSMKKFFKVRVKNSVCLFIQHCINCLKDGGRCGLVIDRGILNNGNSANAWEVKLRKMLLTDCNLWKIVNLPTGIFKHTNFATSIIFFKKGEVTKEVEFIEAYFKDEDKGKGDKDFFFKESIKVSVDDIKKKNYSLKLDDYTEKEVVPIDTEKWIKLGEIVELVFGTRITKGNDEAKNNDNKCPVYGGGGITFYTKHKFNRHGTTIIISRFGVSPTCVRIIDGELFLNDSGMSVNIKNSNFSFDFLKYYLKFNEKNIFKYASGQGQKNMATEKLKNEFFIPNLPLDHQQEIVKFLDEIYETYKIEDTIKYLGNANIFNLLINKQYDEFKNVIWYQEQVPKLVAQLEQVPKYKNDYIRGLFNTVDGEMVKLGDVVEIKRGKSLPKANIINGKYPVITGCSEITKYHNEYNIDGSNNIFIARVGSAGNVLLCNNNCYLTDLAFGITCNKKKICKLYCFYYFKYTNEINKIIQKNGPPNINGDNLLNIKIKLPSLEDQQKIIEQIEKIESDESHFSVYANTLKKQMELMQETIKNISNIDKTNINNEPIDENMNDNKSEVEPEIESEVEPEDEPIEEVKEVKTKKVTVKKVNKKKSNNNLADV
jgi:type I restriction-modification system DNA methylase subunit/restriction endonuclease S subunit